MELTKVNKDVLKLMMQVKMLINMVSQYSNDDEVLNSIIEIERLMDLIQDTENE